MNQCKYHEYIDVWMNKVIKKEVSTCKEQVSLIKYLNNELKKGVIIDSDLIYEAVEIIEKYMPFKLLDFQKFFIAFVVGVFDLEGNLLFDEYFVLMGRGSGKNGLISALCLYFLSDRNFIKDYNIHIIATSEKQAKTSFLEVHNVIEDNKSLQKHFKRTQEIIQNKTSRSSLEYLTSNAKTKDGGRPGAIIFDEVHQYENYENINVHTGGLGKTERPRKFYITTDGIVRDSVLDDLKEKADLIFKGEVEHNGFFPFIFKLDSEKEANDETKWEKSIPRINYDNTLKRTVKKEYNDMKNNIELKEAFMTKRMNIPYVSKSRVVASWEDILATKDHEWSDFTYCDCIGGVDYSDFTDFCSVGLLFKHGGKRYFKQHTFIHEKSLLETEYNFNVNEAVEKGWATIIKDTPTIPQEAVAEWFEEQASRYNILKIMADTFRATALREAFNNIGMELSVVRNGPYSNNKIEPLITKIFIDKTIAFEDDKLMRWYVNNVGVEMDKKQNRTFIKIEPRKRKTDGFFCFLHAMMADEELVEQGDFVLFDIIT